MMSAMTKRLTHDLTYDAPLADVAAMLSDPAFREQVCDAQGVLRHEVTVEPDGEGKRVRVDRVQASRGLPSAATRIVGASAPAPLLVAGSGSSPNAASAAPPAARP